MTPHSFREALDALLDFHPDHQDCTGCDAVRDALHARVLALYAAREGVPCLVTGHGYGDSGVPFLLVSGSVECFGTGDRVYVTKGEAG